MKANGPSGSPGNRSIPKLLWPRQREVDAEFEVLAWCTPQGLQVRVDGSPTIDQLVSTLHVFGIESQALDCAAMLMDLRLLMSSYSHPELARIGYEMATSFTHLARLALLVPAHRRTGIAQRAANRQGVDLRVFDEEAAALQWLADGKASLN